jgi:hypothetical protein
MAAGGTGQRKNGAAGIRQTHLECDMLALDFGEASKMVM